MTRAQQIAGKELEKAQAAYLLAYGWRRAGAGWTHPKVPFPSPLTSWDALIMTRAEPRLGW